MKITREFQAFFGLQWLDFIPQILINGKMSDIGYVVRRYLET